ncbi:putative amidohydrolase family protein [Elsinoe australis]|uniref:Putative amidohydrolase family protein n=1 Tax=Elsinoe australis TaxID=40998 RepID=A0A4U7AUY8_9PEZI|nr:putative amidohydrolase family protein [Elsinoe australis]
MGIKVFQDGTVITFDDDTQAVKVLPKASVLVVDDRIAAIAEQLSGLPKDADLSAAEVINVEGKIVSPGFVNTHVHSWQTVFRTLGPNVILASYFDWLSARSRTAIETFSADDVYFSCLEGYLEGLNAGVTSYVEHAHNNWNAGVFDAGHRAATDSGARVWYCPDVSPHDGYSKDEQWEKIRQTFANTSSTSTVLPGLAVDGLVISTLAGPEEERKQLLKQIKDHNLQALTLHHLGGPWGQANSTPTKVCERGLHTAEVPIIFSHSSFLTESDMEVLRKHDLNASVTPESECHFGHGNVACHRISDQASLGTDTGWTFSADMITQARLWLQIVRKGNYERTLATGLIPNATPMTVEQAFLLTTRQGGRALRRKDIGVLQVGAKADIVVFDGESPNMLGWSDALAAVILHANVSDIEHVLVGGEFRKKDFKLVDGGKQTSWAEVKTRFVEAAKRIQSQLKTPPPLPDKLWGFGQFGDVDVASTIRRGPCC